MATKFFDNNGIVSFNSISSEEDLKLRPRISINPPPSDGKCQCCGKHISGLKPFGKAGDPLVGDFEGALLIKNFRPEGPYDEEAETAVDNAEFYCRSEESSPRDWMINKYGKEKGESLHCRGALSRTVGKSWECRDCIVLDDEEYFEKVKYWSEEKTEGKLVK